MLSFIKDSIQALEGSIQHVVEAYHNNKKVGEMTYSKQQDPQTKNIYLCVENINVLENFRNQGYAKALHQEVFNEHRIKFIYPMNVNENYRLLWDSLTSDLKAKP